MKYAITGHTQGIGKHLFERLQPNAIGFSKSTGYDINDRTDRARIILESQDCDVFINNAWDGFGQVNLLVDLFKVWHDKEDKTIINVGSKITDHILGPDQYYLLEYQSNKLALTMMTSKIITMKPKCTIKYKWFGYVGTEKILKAYPNLRSYISEAEAADIILS